MYYRIKQLPKINDYSFMSYDFAVEHGFTLNDYEVVYEDSLPTEFKEMNILIVLDFLFTKFNVARPSDFTGHSLSTSDIIELNGVNYYCDSIGWKRLDA